MPRSSSSSKISKIEKQIQELQAQKENLLNDLYVSIGKKLVEEWDLTNKGEAEKWIKKFANEVKGVVDSDSTVQSNEQSNH